MQYNQKAKELYLKTNGLYKSSSVHDLKDFTSFLASGNVDQYLLERLSRVSAKHREFVYETLDEFQRNRQMNYTLIYPASGSNRYDKYFDSLRQSNQLLYKYLFTKNELYSLTKQLSDQQKQYIIEREEFENNQYKSLEVDDKIESKNEVITEVNEDEKAKAFIEETELQIQKQITEQSLTPNFKFRQNLKVATGASNADDDRLNDDTSSPVMTGSPVFQDGTDQKGDIQFTLNIKEIEATPEQKHRSSESTGKASPKYHQTEPKSALIQTTKLLSPLAAESNQSGKGKKVHTSSHTSFEQHPGSTTPRQKEGSPAKLSRKKVESNKSSKSSSHKRNKLRLKHKQGSMEKLNKETEESSQQMNGIEMSPEKAQLEQTPEGGKSAEVAQQLHSSTAKSPEKKKLKMLITGDDILIEYVARIIKLLQNIIAIVISNQDSLVERVDDIIPHHISHSLDMFTKHRIWSNKLTQEQLQQPLVKRMQVRHKEMINRRTKILSSLLKKKHSKWTKEEIEKELKEEMQDRDKIITKISVQKLEKMVKQSNLENKIEIVSILLDGSFTLPSFMQITDGKNCVNGTLTGLKMFEKIIKSEQYNALFKNLAGNESRAHEFNSDTKLTRNENLSLHPHSNKSMNLSKPGPQIVLAPNQPQGRSSQHVPEHSKQVNYPHIGFGGELGGYFQHAIGSGLTSQHHEPFDDYTSNEKQYYSEKNPKDQGKLLSQAGLAPASQYDPQRDFNTDLLSKQICLPQPILCTKFMSRKQKQIFLSDKMPYENDESKIKMSNMLNINKTFDSIIKKDDPKYDKTAAKEYTVRPQFAGPQDSVQKIQAKIMVPQHHRNSQSFIAGLQNPEMKIGKAEPANGGADKRQKSYRNKYNMISISNEIQSQPEQAGQQFQLQRELGNTMKINLQNNRQGGQSQKSHYKDAEMTQLQAYQHFHTPSLNQHRKATQSNFSPM